MDRRIAALLNSSNLSETSDKENITGLITEYFASDETEDNEWSDSDSDSDEEDESETPTPRPIDEEEIEEPVVRVEGFSNDIEGDFVGREEEANLLRRAREFSCGCKLLAHGNDEAAAGVVNDPAEENDRRVGCIRRFTPDEIVQYHLQVKEMERAELDLHVVSVLHSCMRNGEQTECTHRKTQKAREKSRTDYCLMSRRLCRTAFLFLLDNMNRKRLDRLMKHYKNEGLSVPRLRSGGRKNNTACLSLLDTERVVTFIRNFAEDHAVSLPGRVPGFKRDDIRLLPSAYPKSIVYRRFRTSAEAAGHRVVAASTFRRLWQQFCPYVVVARPMTDLCWKCQQNNTNIFRSANLTLEEKAELIQEQQLHLSQVDAERRHYNHLKAAAKDAARRHQVQGLGQNPANSKNCVMHYSFDYAQQVHFPTNAAQPGPMYFMTARKCGIFGIHCEGLPRQVNYLIDEGVSCSKGSNSVISYLHHFFDNFGLGETDLELHCDNCAGQNKNRYVLWYFCWRVQTGLHTSVTLNFMPPGHTKFSPDWCFGLFKRRFRRQEISCLEDICDAVLDSTPISRVNEPQLVGTEDGTVLVPAYNWQEFFTPAYKPLAGMKNISHFMFNNEHPGTVFYKSSLAENYQQKDIVNMHVFEQMPQMPHELRVPGLSRERQAYLFNNIRQFVRQDKKDLVCPRPV